LAPEPLPAGIAPGSPGARQFERDQQAHPPVWEQEFGEVVRIAPGFIKRDHIAWYASHHHSADGANQAYSYAYLFAYVLDVPPGARTVTLPNDAQLRVMAVTAVDDADLARPAHALYDVLGNAR